MNRHGFSHKKEVFLELWTQSTAVRLTATAYVKLFFPTTDSYKAVFASSFQRRLINLIATRNRTRKNNKRVLPRRFGD